MRWNFSWSSLFGHAMIALKAAEVVLGSNIAVKPGVVRRHRGDITDIRKRYDKGDRSFKLYCLIFRVAKRIREEVL